jgi:hypothetical protein
MAQESTLQFLLTGDVSIQYQTQRDLLNQDRKDLQDRIANEGWGARFLDQRNENGHWGAAYYQPKWTSTHYTLLDLKNLHISPEQREIRDTLQMVLDNEREGDPRNRLTRPMLKYDLCITGMFLNCAAYFKMPQDGLDDLIDFILEEHMHDGGFNCRSTRSHVVHSSLHTTISILEGFLEYLKSDYEYCAAEVETAKKAAQEFILQHRLFRSDTTGEIIDKRFLLLSYPSRWRYDILRALDYFRAADHEYDPRMQDAIDVLNKKQRKDGYWPVQGKHPGQTHFDMEQTGEPSRWNTLRALRVFQHFNLELPE